ncbi:hypothetical protein RQP46_003637 [Phenoliferia psychrophenolica]
MLIANTLTVAGLVATAIAHADHAPRGYKHSNLIARRDLEKRCGSQLANQRLARRNAKRSLGLKKRASTDSSDSVCTMTPEVTQGPYHILGELVRQNITEGQAGVPLEVQINVIDISTCEPVQVWIDAWHANATGYYSGYVAETGATLATGSTGSSGGNSTGGGDMSGGGNSTMSGNFTMSGNMTGGGGGGGPSSSSSTNTSDYTALSGADSASAASQLDTVPDDEGTFLRGVWQSDADGLATMYSIVPGWYTGRAVHFHVKVYTNGSVASNGTFIATDLAHHVGQFFFDNTTMAAVAATSDYAANAVAYEDHTFNEADQWYPYQEATGYNADMDITWVGDDISDGLIGSITIGLNMSYSAVELSTQYAAFDVSEYVEEGLLTTTAVSESASKSGFATSSTAKGKATTVKGNKGHSTTTKGEHKGKTTKKAKATGKAEKQH